MISMIRAMAKLCIVVAALAAFLPIVPSYAGTNTVAYMSSTGSGTTCSAATPCGSFENAIFSLAGQNGRVVCLSPPTETTNVNFGAPGFVVDIDCPQGTILLVLGPIGLGGSNQTLKVRNMTFAAGAGATTGIFHGGSGASTMIFENCVFEKFPQEAFDIEPSGQLNLVIRNSRISNSGSGMLIKPPSGGSIKATFDHVVVTGNNGGGIKVDTTNGPVTVDITDSEISSNGGNGLNAVGGAGGPAIFNIHNGVIAKNGVAGVQVNGATAAAMIDTTLLDNNASGATSVVNGGHILTYGNNRIVGIDGSGFTGSAALR